MAATREGKLRFLVCTDVAARGIDISHLTHVINADFPESTENYVHRTGRTGRAGRTGTAISLITPQDVGNLYMLRLTYKIFPVERDLPRPLELKSRKEADMVQFLKAAFSAARLGASDKSLARRILASDDAELIVAGLLADHLGAHPNAEETAASLRREARPASVEEPRKKKKKKKKDKDHKEKNKPESHEASQPESLPPASDRAPASSAPSSSTAESSGPEALPSTPAATSSSASTPKEETARPRGSRRDAAFEASRDDAAAEEKPRDPSRKGSRALPAESFDSDGLQTISAAELLSAEERAILRGESDVEPQEPSTSGSFRANSPASESAQVFVDVGARDSIDSEDFLDTLADVGFPIGEVEKVVIRDSHSFIHVPRTLLTEALECLDGEEVAGLVVHAEEARPRRGGTSRPLREKSRGPSRRPRRR